MARPSSMMVSVAQLMRFTNPGDTAIPVASTALLLYGGYRILQDRMTLGDLTMFLFYMAMLLGPLATLAASATAFQNSLAALDRILDLLAEPLETEDTTIADLAVATAPRSTIRRFRTSIARLPI